MKKIALLLYLTLTATIGWAADYHLVQSQIIDGVAPGAPLESLTVYVLIRPDTNPLVFKTFDSKLMEQAISNLPRESILHYEGSGLMPQPAEAQFQSIKACCQKKNISFVGGLLD
jgi:hypothetical protein